MDKLAVENLPSVVRAATDDIFLEADHEAGRPQF